jgi:cation:H+ antiporter
MTAILFLVVGIVTAGLGGELFVRGSVGAAARARIPAGIIGATVAAFATSSPEFAVAVSSAVAGKPEIALGDALGSSVVNIGLVLGIALVIAGLMVSRADFRRDLPVAFAAPLLLGALSLDGGLGRADGAVLIAVFAAWLTVTARQAVHFRSNAASVMGDRDVRGVVRDTLVGLALLVLSGQLLVRAAKRAGEALGWDVFTVGAILVAVGTSAPELATTIMARLRGHDDVGVGTVIGSNIFNTLWIVGIAAVIHPIDVAGKEVTIAIVAGMALLLLLLPGPTGRLGRGRGVALLAGYVAYLVALLTLHDRI